MFNPTVDSVSFLLIQWNPSRADTITAKKTVRFSMIMYKIDYKFLLVSYTHSTTWTFIRTSPSPQEDCRVTVKFLFLIPE